MNLRWTVRSGGWCGSARWDSGDVNNDSADDLAIAAPFEDIGSILA